VTKVKWKDLRPEVKEAARRAIGEGAEYILQKANETVPHREGHLQRSGIVSHDSSKPIANISYDTPYAVRLHEHPEYHFNNGRRGKWLELTLEEETTKVRDYIAKRLKEVLS
jgi:hypothetical protein